MERTGLERATHPLPRLGVPLHHRTKHLPQNGCHFLLLCAKSQIIASKQITKPPADLAHSNAHKLSKPMETSYGNPAGLRWLDHASKSISRASISGISHWSNF